MDSWNTFPDLFELFSIDQPDTDIYNPCSALQSFNESTPQQAPSYAHHVEDHNESLYSPGLPQEPFTHSLQDTPSLDNVAPPATRRKRKVPTLRAEDWEPYKARILELHDAQKLPLGKVKTMIEEEFGFIAEIRQYRTRITQWGKDKNIKKQEMEAIVRKRQKRSLVETDKREQTFTVRGRNVEPNKIDRWMFRHQVSQASLYAPSPAASTPSAVFCRTISDRGSVAPSPVYSTRSLNFSPRSTTSMISSPIPSSPASLGRNARSQSVSSDSTGESLVPPYQPPPAILSMSHPGASNDIVHDQLPRRYLQDYEQCTRDSLAVAERSFVFHHPQKLALKVKLGCILASQGRYQHAENMARDAVERCRLIGGNSVNMVNAMALLGEVACLTGSYNQACEQQRLVFETRLEIFGEEHPSTLDSMMSLSWIHLQLRNLREAEERCDRALEISKRTFGEKSPLAIDATGILSGIYLAQGRSEEAEKLQLQALAMSKDVLGEEHPYTIINQRNLATMYKSQERLQEAGDLGAQVLVAMKRVIGKQHPETLSFMEFLAEIYEHQGQLAEAEELWDQRLVSDMGERFEIP